MSGVQVGTRLERLHALRERIALEIREEERRLALQRPKFEVFTKPGRDGKNATERHLEELDVTARQVKDWALSVGLIDEVKRGRIGSHLVDAYADAHRGGRS